MYIPPHLDLTLRAELDAIDRTIAELALQISYYRARVEDAALWREIDADQDEADLARAAADQDEADRIADGIEAGDLDRHGEPVGFGWYRSA
jgi:hypothetical protein